MQNSKLITILVLFGWLFIFSSCSFFRKTNVKIDFCGKNTLSKTRSCFSENKDGSCKDNCIIMTVFVHGTVLPHGSLKAFVSSIKNYFSRYKNSEKSFYQAYLKQLRRRGIYKRQSINELGLVQINFENILPKDPFYISSLVVRLYKKVQDHVKSCFNNKNLFYTFGWSGRLSNFYRRIAAQELYSALLVEIKKVERRTKLPVKIHLVAHSHGGNVVLNLVDIEKKQKQKLKIEKLVLFGCPVQSETKFFVKDSIFEKVYHIYSKGDHVQIADAFSTKDFFSQRCFKEDMKDSDKTVSKLHQISLTSNSFKPNHWELWFFGYKRFPHFFYRKRFPLHPLPVMIFTPIFIDIVDSCYQSSFFSDIDIKEKSSFCTFFVGDKSFYNIDISEMKRIAFQLL